MVKVRLSRAGAKKRPYYHIVVTDRENSRDGRCIERIGRYDPKLPIETVRVDLERLEHWVGVGALVSDRVSKVVKEYRKATAAAAG